MLEIEFLEQVLCFPYLLPFYENHCEVHINGALHSLLDNISHVYLDKKSFKIMGFSFENKNHHESILLIDILENVSIELDIVGVRLSLNTVSEFHVGIWVIKKYGVEESRT